MKILLKKKYKYHIIRKEKYYAKNHIVCSEYYSISLYDENSVCIFL